MANLFGGGDGGAAVARRDAQKSRELQQIAADRQLAQVQAEDSKTVINRRRPRGRKLFAEDGGKTNLS